jgi:hypothetical protein
MNGKSTFGICPASPSRHPLSTPNQCSLNLRNYGGWPFRKHCVEVAITPFPFPYHNIISVFLLLSCKPHRWFDVSFFSDAVENGIVRTWLTWLRIPCMRGSGHIYIYKCTVLYTWHKVATFFITLLYILLYQSTLPYITVYHIPFHFIPFHSMSLQSTPLHCALLHYIARQNDIALHSIALRYIWHIIRLPLVKVTLPFHMVSFEHAKSSKSVACQVDVHLDGTRTDQWYHHGPGFREFHGRHGNVTL